MKEILTFFGYTMLFINLYYIGKNSERKDKSNVIVMFVTLLIATIAFVAKGFI